MSEVLYRKYRPQNFNEIVGQEAIITTLQKALGGGQITHAYLFAGPKGTGKTTTARILAKALNCQAHQAKKIKPDKSQGQKFNSEPCNKCDYCQAISEGNFLDLIEIDAASNRGIDEIRELKEKVAYPPTTGRFKVYIIDEVHMLTKEAANALLKTLEEPPRHVIFILCTTEPHKILPTVVSRCQRYDFHRASIKDIVKRLEQILSHEKVKFSKESLVKIAQNASGGFRDAEALLSKLFSLSEGKEITSELVVKALGLIEGPSVAELVEFLYLGKAKEAIEKLGFFEQQGVDIIYLISRMIEYLRVLMLIKAGVGDELLDLTKEDYESLAQKADVWSDEEITALLTSLNEVQKDTKYATLMTLPLEMLSIKRKLLKRNFQDDLNDQKLGVKDEIAVNLKTETNNATLKEDPSVGKKKKVEKDDEKLLEQVVLKWQDILKNIRPHNHSIEALLRACQPLKVSNKTLHLEFYYLFHKEKIEEPKSREIVEKVLSELTGRKMQVKCFLGGHSPKKLVQTTEKGLKGNLSELIKTATEVFPGAVVES